uniref:PX domain-containing protein n=1 Tax=Macrostomum lignano TaxID=282301 RepID=A0A1I8GB14_9PLAT
ESRGLPLFSHRVYSIRCGHSTTEGVVRRYSDFRRLHESLVQRRPHWLIPELPTRGRPELPTLPGASGLAMRQRRQRRLFLEEREAGLQDYLTALRRHPVLATATRSSFSDEDGDASIESWISSQREAITGRLKILVEIRTCLDRHREAALAAAGAIRCIAEKLPPKLSAASSLIEGDALAVDDGALLRAADETSERCEAEWLASQSIDCLQMMLVGYLRLHDRLTSTAATASSSGGSAKTTALRLVRDRLRLESGPINALGGWQLRQLLLQVVGVQLQGNL